MSRYRAGGRCARGEVSTDSTADCTPHSEWSSGSLSRQLQRKSSNRHTSFPLNEDDNQHPGDQEAHELQAPTQQC